MNGSTSEIVASFERQATACDAMDAPFTARLCRLLPAALDQQSGFGRRALGWPLESLLPDLMPLRCCAALNILVRAGAAPHLASFYPPRANNDDAGFRRAIRATIAAHDPAMTAFLDSPPQTNEVVRSAVLLGGFLHIAARTEAPLALHELGASAGLNLMFDRYLYDLGADRTWGPPDSHVRIVSAWRGSPPTLDTPLVVASRAAVDLRPVDAGAPEDRQRMLAYIWPEQFERLRRIEAALDLVAASRLLVEQGEALAWLKTRMAAPARSGVCRVVYHSVFAQYLPVQVREGLRAALQEIGAQATEAAPFAWLAMESAPDRMSCELRLTLWPGGERHVLAKVDWHGRWAEWA